VGVRRVVTRHRPNGAADVVSDEIVDSFPVRGEGSSTTFLWGRDGIAQAPDNGTKPPITAVPPPGGSQLIMELAPSGGGGPSADHQLSALARSRRDGAARRS
jgi:hypothetical protein